MWGVKCLLFCLNSNDIDKIKDFINVNNCELFVAKISVTTQRISYEITPVLKKLTKPSPR